MAPRKKTDIVQLSKIRMREGLRARLARDAERKDVTLNAEIVERLEGSYTADEDTRRDSQIVKMLLGFSSENDQMAQLLFHLFREMKDLGETEIMEITNRMGGLLEQVKKKSRPKGEINNA